MSEEASVHRDPKLDRDRLLIVIATIVVNIVVVLALTFAPWSNWRTGLGLNLIDNAMLIAFAVIKRDRLMWHFILFGLLVGFIELVTDAWIVNVSGSLDYKIGGGPMIWKSPIWMPLAWEVVAVQFGYIGLRLYENLRWFGLILTGLIGAINIPFYEEMALKIHWWRYHDVAMAPHTHTPWAIILGEFLIAIEFGYLATFLRPTRLGRTIFAGIIAGVLIFACYFIAYWSLAGLSYQPTTSS